MKLLRLFLGNPGEAFYVRELARKVGSQIHAIRRELENLDRLGIIQETVPKGEAVDLLRARTRRYYELDGDFFLVEELRALVLKSQFLLEHELKRRIQQLGTVRYFALLGMFVGKQGAPVDVLIVGSLRRERLARLMRQFERDLGKTVNYTVMSVRDFQYRWDVGDRFLYEILDGEKITVVDELSPAARAATTGTVIS